MNTMIRVSLNALFLLVAGCSVAPVDKSEPLGSTSQELQSLDLTINFSGRGFGIVSASPVDDNFRSGCFISACTLEYVAGSPAQIVLTESPLGVSTFSGWVNCPHPSGATCTVDNNMPNIGVLATFACSRGIDQACKHSCVRSCIADGGNGASCNGDCSQACDPCLNG